MFKPFSLLLLFHYFQSLFGVASKLFSLLGTKAIDKVFLHYSYKLTMGFIVAMSWQFVCEAWSIFGSFE